MNKIYKTSRGIRNNNPGNIKLSHDVWQGQRPAGDTDERTFCVFYNIDFGLRALFVLLKNYLIKGYDTPEKIITRFAPSSENHTANYLQFVLTFQPSPLIEMDESLSIKRDTKIEWRSFPFYALCAAICLYESNYILTYSKFNSIIKHFKL